MPIRIALVEDVPALRRRFTERIQFYGQMSLVLVAENGAVFLDAFARLAEAEHPEVVLMDIEMPGLDGIETTRRLRDRYPAVEVMMLTVFEDEDRIFDAIQAGAAGYLLKDTSADALVEAVEELHRGGAPMSPAVARKTLALLRQDQPPQPTAAADAFALSEREAEILRAIVDDETEQGIAERLFLSPHTIRTHVKNIYRKLHVRSRAGAVRLALERRLV